MQIQTFACILAGLLALSCTFQTVLTESDPEKIKSMADTLRMLQNLDKYYAQVARPSPRSSGSSGFRDLGLSKVQEAFHKIRLRELDRNYLQRTRPRFGKRGDYPRFQEQILNGEDIQLPEQRLWDRLVR